jgi:hypothetical protein
MNNYTVVDASGGAGWNITVNGDNSTGKSPVFAQYCAAGPCGTDPTGFVSGGQKLAPDSLTLNSTGAGFTGVGGTTGTAPTHSCNSGCSVDSATPVKTVLVAAGTGMGTWATTDWGAGTSLSLAAPTTVQALPNGEIYHVDLVWTLSTGP